LPALFAESLSNRRLISQPDGAFVLMADKLKSVHCVRDLRDAPLEEYTLPDDKRQWKQVARNRQALANFLATFADGDGSRIFPTVETMTKHFGWSRATTFRLLADLRALNLLSEKIGLRGESGPAIRKMDVVGFRKRTFTGSAALVKNAFSGVSNSDDQESQTQEQASQSHDAGVSNSIAGVSPSVRHIPPRFTATETATSTATNSQTEQQAGGWRLLQEKHMAEIGYFGRKATDFQKHIDDYGFDIVDAATKAALDEGNLENAKSVSGIILHRLGKTLAAEVKIRNRADQQKKQDEFQAASIERQTLEFIARRDRPSPVAEATFDDFMEDELEVQK
jgi:hypothetical protein